MSMVADELTVDEIQRWLKKLKQLGTDSLRAEHVHELIRKERERLAAMIEAYIHNELGPAVHNEVMHTDAIVAATEILLRIRGPEEPPW